ncbi:stage VI sporulation protein F [Tannockella kyphosi]|uniref:stage VI sporulation protein F n=1 Tax=Tannockella kyphosi TaxID=2899121 RepID=UPI0020137DAF|nr:stage VI sporulation protein F [Tannockella kyphosi]
MQNNDPIIDKVVKKTNVKKEDIFALANILQTKNLKKEEDVRDFIDTVCTITNKQIDATKKEKLVQAIKNNKVPKEIEKML